MPPQPAQPITKHFASLPDPRIERTKLHQLQDILVIAICAIICGADDWVAVEAWGNAKRTWLGKFLDLPNGIPSHDTFGRVFARLDPKAFQKCFLKWIRAIAKQTHRQIVSIDGKKLRRSHDRTLGKSAIAMVSAWATANRLVLGQRKVKDKSNEITAIPPLLRVLELAGCIVTIDAIGCQTEIADVIVQQNADYLLAVKENQGQLYQDVQDLFAGCREVNFRDVPHDHHKTVNKGHWTHRNPRVLDTVGS
jgi:predicted transposase YbfD/YdcC